MLRRLTAFLGMITILGLVGVLVWEVVDHHRDVTGESAIVAILARPSAVIA
jgi:flagellar biogenesis protein FliO